MPQINNNPTQAAKPFFINTKQQDKLFTGLDSAKPAPPRELNGFERLAVGTYDVVSSITRLFGVK